MNKNKKIIAREFLLVLATLLLSGLVLVSLHIRNQYLAYKASSLARSSSLIYLEVEKLEDDQGDKRQFRNEFYRLSKRKWFYKSRDGNFDAKRNLWKWVNQEEYLESYDDWNNYYSTAVAQRNLYDELDYQLDFDFSFFQKVYFTDWLVYFYPEHDSESSLWEYLAALNSSDSLDTLWYQTWKYERSGNLLFYLDSVHDVVSLEEFRAFINSGLYSTAEQAQINVIDSLQTLAEEQESEANIIRRSGGEWSSDDILEITWYVLITLLIVVFPLRYLFYAIRWSIRQLRTSD